MGPSFDPSRVKWLIFGPKLLRNGSRKGSKNGQKSHFLDPSKRFPFILRSALPEELVHGCTNGVRGCPNGVQGQPNRGIFSQKRGIWTSGRGVQDPKIPGQRPSGNPKMTLRPSCRTRADFDVWVNRARVNGHHRTVHSGTGHTTAGVHHVRGF